MRSRNVNLNEQVSENTVAGLSNTSEGARLRATVAAAWWQSPASRRRSDRCAGMSLPRSFDMFCCNKTLQSKIFIARQYHDA
jgi:hypothetical protein